MPDDEGSNLIEKFIQVVIRQFMGDIRKNIRRLVKRAVRMIAMAIAGVIIAVIGIAFLSVGAVKWFSMLMPGWLAWAIVGMVLILTGVILMQATASGFRN